MEYICFIRAFGVDEGDLAGELSKNSAHEFFPFD